MEALFSTSYWPPIACFSGVKDGDVWVIEQHEHYQKQTFRSRCSICGANGPQWLIVPVLRHHGEKTPINEVMLDQSVSWQQVHWRAIVSAYKTSPYFDYFADDIAPLYVDRSPQRLLDFNTKLLRCCFQCLEVKVSIRFTEAFLSLAEARTQGVLDYRQDQPMYLPKPYYQVFARKQGFVPGQSILDLMFNEGPEAWRYLEPEADSQ